MGLNCISGALRVVWFVGKDGDLWAESFTLTTRIIVAVILREKEKLKEREEAWLKIDELARENPNVSTLDCQIIKDNN